MRLTKKQSKIIKHTKNKLNELGLSEGEDYIIFLSKEETSKIHKESFKIQFRLKGNKKVVALLTELGWQIDKRYCNDNGSPSIYETEIHNKGLYKKNVVMQRMEYALKS